MVLAHNINKEQRTQDIRITEDVTFDTMLLSRKTLCGLKNSGFYKPSPIQLHGIPLGKCGFDLLLEAKSGTGKTAVFSVIALEKLDFNKGLQIVILAPTREIAAQIWDVIKQIGSEYEDLTVEVVMGGLPVLEDISKFKKKVHIVVGSPGRLKHLIKDNHIDISAVRLLVLDEADKLMEKSFLTDINYIFSVLPRQKQVIMSSATYPESCKSFMNNYVQNAQHICPDSNSILLGIAQQVTTVKHNSNIVRQTQHRFEELLKILIKKQFKQCLIFCNYQARVAELHKMLIREKWPAELLYGQQEQTDRLDALKTLQEYKCRILVTTDLAARGIDASNVDLVINFEPPFEWQTYLHRIGRTGRFGSYGIAITMLSEGKEVIKFKEMLGSMNVSLDLRYLWTDDKFHIDEFNGCNSPQNSPIPVQSSSEGKLKIDADCKDLWNAIICDNDIYTEEIQRFEDLHLSFQKLCSTSKIESFSDLLCSFQQESDTSEDNGTYQYVQFQKISTTQYFAETECNITQTQPFSNSNSKMNKVENTSEVALENIVRGDCVIQECNNNNDPSFNIKKSYNVETSNRSDKDFINDILCENKPEFNKHHYEEQICSKDKDIEHDVNKALLEAGLPTSFGSTRKFFTKSNHYTNTSKGDYKNRKIYYNSDSEPISENLETFSTKNVPTKSKSRPRKSKGIINTNRVDDSICNNLSLPYKNTHLHGSGNELKTSRHKFEHTHDNYAESNSSNEQINYARENIYHNYNIWYNKLKTYMKHIEYTVFIEEMSKL